MTLLTVPTWCSVMPPGTGCWSNVISRVPIRLVVIEPHFGLAPSDSRSKPQSIWKSTPFYLFVYAPTQYALGNESNAEFLQQLLIGDDLRAQAGGLVSRLGGDEISDVLAVQRPEHPADDHRFGCDCADGHATTRIRPPLVTDARIGAPHLPRRRMSTRM